MKEVCQLSENLKKMAELWASVVEPFHQPLLLLFQTSNAPLNLNAIANMHFVLGIYNFMLRSHYPCGGLEFVILWTSLYQCSLNLQAHIQNTCPCHYEQNAHAMFYACVIYVGSPHHEMNLDSETLYRWTNCGNQRWQRCSCIIFSSAHWTICHDLDFSKAYKSLPTYNQLFQFIPKN